MNFPTTAAAASESAIPDWFLPVAIIAALIILGFIIQLLRLVVSLGIEILMLPIKGIIWLGGALIGVVLVILSSPSTLWKAHRKDPARRHEDTPVTVQRRPETPMIDPQ